MPEKTAREKAIERAEALAKERGGTKATKVSKAELFKTFLPGTPRYKKAH